MGTWAKADLLQVSAFCNQLNTQREDSVCGVCVLFDVPKGVHVICPDKPLRSYSLIVCAEFVAECFTLKKYAWARFGLPPIPAWVDQAPTKPAVVAECRSGVQYVL